MRMLAAVWKHLPDLTVMALAILVQIQFSIWIAQSAPVRSSPALRRAIRSAGFAAAAWVAFGIIGNFASIYAHLPSSVFLYWLRGSAIAWSLATLAAFAVLALWRRVPEFDGGRRGFIRAAGAAAVAAPFGAMAFGILVQRHAFRVREVKLEIPDLPKDLDGLRLVQLSDIHLSPFLSERELARAVAMANETRPHVALVTGDLITSRGDPLDTCLRQLSRLKSDAGTLGCLGNHEVYARAENRAAADGARLGIDFLRRQSRVLKFGSARLNIAGVDYQRFHEPYLVGAEQMIVPGATNILLSHNPDVFEIAAGQGWDLLVSGHTHGGQVTVEILNQNISAARFFTPYVYGLYRNGRSAAWVTRGLGTVGVPARIGAPPEVALIQLCATSS